MVIPDVDLRNLGIGRGERFGRVPSNIVLEVVLVTLIAQVFTEKIVPPLLGVGNGGPLLQRSLDPDRVVVNLVASADHDMKWTLLVRPQDVVPERRACEIKRQPVA